MAQYFRQLSTMLILICLNRVLRTEHEDIFLAGMTVNIDVQTKSSFVLDFQLFCQFNKMVGFWKGKFTSLTVSAIEVLTEQRRSVISSHHSIRVQHWKNIKYVFTSQLDRYRRISTQTLQKSLHNI